MSFWQFGLQLIAGINNYNLSQCKQKNVRQLFDLTIINRIKLELIAFVAKSNTEML